MKKLIYRKLFPVTEGKRKYRFKTTKEFSKKLIGPLAKHPPVYFRDSKGKCWAWILDGYIYIAAGYYWNGCSPKYYIGSDKFGFWVGTPDFEESITASLVHDVLFQFSYLGKFTMEDANMMFYSIMEEEKFLLAEIYFTAVQKLGVAFFGKKDDNLSAHYI